MDLYAKELVKEIETLRLELKETVQAHADEEKRGDEWKWRAKLMWKWMHSGYTYPDAKLYSTDFVEQEPEAADWFEEE